ncbi:MAG: BrnA antitoxin family protein [Bacteroidales bacterium]|jgi:uncharacterized protein (DUF4415 family)|nr:BrnA antitoxin family protein [Bacteroidales bacterium]
MKTVIIRKNKDLPSVDKTMVKKLKSLKDKDIDVSDMPPLTKDDLMMAIPIKLLGRGLYKPVKRPIKINCDADVIEWFRSMGKGYQTKMNLVLRQYMLSRIARSK